MKTVGDHVWGMNQGTGIKVTVKDADQGWRTKKTGLTEAVTLYINAFGRFYEFLHRAIMDAASFEMVLGSRKMEVRKHQNWGASLHNNNKRIYMYLGCRLGSLWSCFCYEVMRNFVSYEKWIINNRTIYTCNMCSVLLLIMFMELTRWNYC